MLFSMMSKSLLSFGSASLVLLALVLSAVYAEQAGEQRDVRQKSAAKIMAPPAGVQAVLNRYCAECHGPENQEGDVRFDTLGALVESDRQELLNRAHEAIHFQEMPPDDMPQPSDDERRLLLNWFSGQSGAQSEALQDKLRYPQYGNLVDHELLFSGEITEPAYTPTRRWLVSPQIFHERVMDVFKLEGWDRDSMRSRQFYGVTNPFVLPEHSGVRDYDIGQLDGGHLLVMLSNAQWIASRQILLAEALSTKGKVDFENPRDKWLPRGKPESYQAFVDVMQAEGTPDRELLVAAIQEQFDCVLRRSATDSELDNYLELLSASIAVAGNEEGLRQMMVAVLLESEFLYRLEFGGSEADEQGRKQLTPREAAFAISYSLGDRGPDAALLEASAEGRLQTKADYRREVERLLGDTSYYHGKVDPSLDGKHYRSNETSHPKLVRFFREFFGYPAAIKVFKDPPRIDGIYQNPGRGTAGTPGWLIFEADKFVTLHMEADQDVFRKLLTSDEFFVYDNMGAEEGRALLTEWRGVWDKLKDTDWQTDPKKVVTEHLEFLKQQKSLRIEDVKHAASLVSYMHFFDESFGQGRTPFTRIPWSHGYYYHHSPLYSLPPTPSIHRYGNHRTLEYKGDKIEKQQFWDYPVEQPFRIENRKGILTHPAWLIAHSTNFHSDPVRRGRWIREKLLAGRVPDVPITVDAQVPDHPDKTFRQRVEEVTAASECWRCHKHMNPLGLPFEAFDDFGRYRTEELLEHPVNLIPGSNNRKMAEMYPTAPVETTGVLTGTGDPSLDGEVQEPFELIERLAESDRVRQSIIRHAFRFFLGRNEMLSDSQTLINADRAYLDSGGSFRAVVVSLLTSDSFMYRKEIKD